MKKLRVCTGHYALVDDDLYDQVCDLFWHFDGTKVFHSAKGKHTSLHNVALPIPRDGVTVIDHIDRNPLNNLRENLRPATHQQNSFNRSKYINAKTTSKYKGVSKVKNKYRASIQFDGKKYHLGYHATEKLAALAYNKKAKKLFGDYSYLNQVEE